jgi:Fuc2NAc and GlcNAc transferase
MDGIDGIAGVEALTTCVGAIAIAFLHAPGSAQWRLPALLAVAVLGFLVWNVPPARIFMGDAGSGFLGVTIGVLALDAGWSAPERLWVWLILLGVFIVDATVTLLRRLARGDRVYEAHRSHAYQQAARRTGSHRVVTLAVGAINLCWLLPWAVVVALGRANALVATAAAYLPLVVAAVALRAGLPDHVASPPGVPDSQR